MYLRIDTIESELGRTAQSDIGDRGYRVAYVLAADNLRLGRDVVGDSANTIEITREAWRGVALTAGRPFVEVELICSDKREHRQRVEDGLRALNNSNVPNWRRC